MNLQCDVQAHIFFNFRQLQKIDEAERVKYVSIKAFYRVSSCKTNLTPGQVEKNSFGIIHSLHALLQGLQKCVEQRHLRTLKFVHVMSVCKLAFIQ